MNDHEFSEWLNADTDGAVGNLLRFALVTAALGAVIGFVLGRRLS